jgi:hypothetical protein
VRFVSRCPGYGISFTPQETILLLGKGPGQAAALQLAVIHTRSDVAIKGVDELPGKVNLSDR